MGFYRYTDEQLESVNVWDILNNLEEGTKREIDLMLSEQLVGCLTLIKDCESPIERMLGVGLYNTQSYWETLADNRALNIFPQMDITCGKKIYRVDFEINTIVNGKEKSVVIECDGHEFHEKTKQQAIKNRQRERDLIKIGYTVVRFTGSEIFNNLYKCINEIREILFGN
jgi:very-short-patch-repair endonuclease